MNKVKTAQTLKQITVQARACVICEKNFPHGVRPVFQVHNEARILIAGQAPGAKVHASGIPFDDASGERLRHWMGVEREQFYDEKLIAILPMSFCYPGKGKSGDLPPPPICADTWRKRFLNAMPAIQLTLVIGQYAQGWHLDERHKNLTETVRAWSSYPDSTMPLPHPSPRNNIWLKKNAWFEQGLLPVLQTRVRAALR